MPSTERALRRPERAHGACTDSTRWSGGAGVALTAERGSRRHPMASVLRGIRTPSTLPSWSLAHELRSAPAGAGSCRRANGVGSARAARRGYSVGRSKACALQSWRRRRKASRPALHADLWAPTKTAFDSCRPGHLRCGRWPNSAGWRSGSPFGGSPTGLFGSRRSGPEGAIR